MIDTTDTTTQTEALEPASPEKQAETPAEPNEDQLGDAGKRALSVERKARREAEHKAAEATKRVASLEAAQLRRDVAADKGLTDAQAQFLEGDDREDMEAKADALLEAFRAEEGDVGRRRPRERLKTGAVPNAEPLDLGTIADDVMKSW